MGREHFGTRPFLSPSLSGIRLYFVRPHFPSPNLLRFDSFLNSRCRFSGDSRPAILGIVRFAIRGSVPLSRGARSLLTSAGHSRVHLNLELLKARPVQFGDCCRTVVYLNPGCGPKSNRTSSLFPGFLKKFKATKFV